MNKKQMLEAERDELCNEGIRELQEVAPKGSRLYTIVRYVSQNRMRRHISVFIIRNNMPFCLDRKIAKLGLFKLSKVREGLVVRGCGMDMCFHVVYETGYVVYGDGYAYEKRGL